MRAIIITAGWIGLHLLWGAVPGKAAEDRQQLVTAIEALTRLENVNLEEKPAIKSAVLRLLDRTRGGITRYL